MTEPILMNFGLLILQTVKVLILWLTDELGGKGWFVVRSCITNTIKLAMAGTSEWWRRFWLVAINKLDLLQMICINF